MFSKNENNDFLGYKKSPVFQPNSLVESEDSPCCPTCVSHIPKVPSIMTEMLVNGLNVQWQVVMRASSYVEIRLILGVDA